MIEYERPRLPDVEPPRIKIVAVGGAGMNAVDRLALDGIAEADLIALNTDVQNLTASMVPLKIQIGAAITRGLGAGGDPEIGYTAAEEATTELEALLAETDLLFLCGGLGGGTGSGALPVLAALARSKGIPVLAVVTLPFNFEGRRRVDQAAQALALLEAEVDAVVCFENDRMGEMLLPKAGIHQAFAAADLTISRCIRSMVELITRRGLIEVGLEHLLTTLRRAASRSVFGFGEAAGENRVHDALATALKNPLMDRGKMLEEANHLLVQIVGGKNLTLAEVEQLMEELGRHVSDRTQILLAVSVDPTKENKLSVTLLSSIGGSAPVRAVSRGPAPAIPAPVIPVSAPAEPTPSPKPIEPTPAPAPALVPHITLEPERERVVEAPVAVPAEPETLLTPALFEAAVELAKSEPAREPEPERAPEMEEPVSNPKTPHVSAAKKQAEKEALARQETLQFEPINRGRFEKSEPTIEDGQDLDVPAFLRKNVKL